MPLPRGFKTELFLDGAHRDEMFEAYSKREVSGFTTNPTLMRKAGVTDYEAFAHEVVAKISDLPISFEVFSDTFEEMEREARQIATWGKNVFVKIPISNTKGDSAVPLIRKLSAEGLSLNITAMMTLDQVRAVAGAISAQAKTIVSIFAGRIADTGRDPVPIMAEAVRVLASNRHARVLWASPRELLNLFQADQCGCHILTATADIIKKLSLVGKDLDEYSLETVRMFYNDAQAARFSIR